MKVQLVMLPRPILVSDEEKIIFNYVWNPDVNKILRVTEHFVPHGQKIIAGRPHLPHIDFSRLNGKELNQIDKKTKDIKIFDIVIEMSCVHTDHVVGGFDYFPTVINGSIVILKLSST